MANLQGEVSKIEVGVKSFLRSIPATVTTAYIIQTQSNLHSTPRDIFRAVGLAVLASIIKGVSALLSAKPVNLQ